jgi:hypothetical protein
VILFAEMITDPSAWDEALATCDCEFTDVFHQHAYMAIEAARLSGRAVLLHLLSHGKGFALPLIFRKIPDQANLCDATSAYGYSGCVYGTSADKALKVEIADSFARKLYIAGCVSVFGRGHPFIAPLIPSTIEVGETIFVDLKAGEQAYEKELAKGHLYEIRKLRGSGIRLEHDTLGAHLNEFHRIYIETMVRCGAAMSYHFTADYLRQLLARPELGAELHLAWSNTQLVAGALFLRHRKLSHYHLSASVPGVTKYPATKLILDEFIRNEIRRGHSEKLHLGGGVGAVTDSLSRFKRGFAGKPTPYHQTRWIIRPVDYDRLSAGKTDTGFFPRYRNSA